MSFQSLMGTINTAQHLTTTTTTTNSSSSSSSSKLDASFFLLELVFTYSSYLAIYLTKFSIQNQSLTDDGRQSVEDEFLVLRRQSRFDVIHNDADIRCGVIRSVIWSVIWG